MDVIEDPTWQEANRANDAAIVGDAMDRIQETILLRRPPWSRKS